jgi:hypothetical protein
MVDVEEIKYLLERDYEFELGYTIDQVTGEVSTRGSAKFQNPNISQMSVKFVRVGSNFSCGFNALTTLENSPREVAGSFYANNNQLKDLKGGPQSVGLTYDCDHNQLETLEGAPNVINRHFDCSWNNLTDLRGAPRQVLGDLALSMNKELKTFEGGPELVGRSLMAFEVALLNLNGLPEKWGPNSEVVLDYQRHLPLLRLLNAPRIDLVGAPTEVREVLKAHLGHGKKGMLHVAYKLTKSGYKENARW